MFFIGDISVPDIVTPVVKGFPEHLHTQKGVANLEGTLVEGADAELYRQSKVFNGTSAIAFLKSLGVEAVSLGNNHAMDVAPSFERGLSLLDEAGIARCGAGVDLEDASRPAVVCEGGTEYVLLSFGWDVVECPYASERRPGVSPLEIDHVTDCVRRAREEHPDSRIVVLPHWDYELERWPMPMHRVLAMRAIEAGADAVVGHHPHCVQGFETFYGKPVFYSLGNWFFADSVYMAGKTKFPAYAHREVAIEWSNNGFICHWFDFIPEEQRLVFDKSESAGDSGELAALSPFRGMGEDEYVKWFRRNRVKSKGLPVFSSYERPAVNSAKKGIVGMRGQLLSLLWKSGVRRRRSGVR